MSRVINPESAARERTILLRSIVLALRELMKQQDANDQTKDLAAYISLALESIHATIETSIVAWEKRGYWLKADRFQMEWAWTERLSGKLKQAVLDEDWPSVAMLSAQVAEKVKSVDVPQRNRIGAPWVGAWVQLKQNAG